MVNSTALDNNFKIYLCDWVWWWAHLVAVIASL